RPGGRGNRDRRGKLEKDVINVQGAVEMLQAAIPYRGGELEACEQGEIWTCARRTRLPGLRGVPRWISAGWPFIPEPPRSRYKPCMNRAENERLRRLAFAAQNDCAKMQAKCVEQWVENYQQRVRLDAMRQRAHALRDRN